MVYYVHGGNRATEKRKTKMVLITGNTYPVKDQLKSLGARWDAGKKGWLVSPEKADQAKSIVESTGGRKFGGSASGRFGRRTGCSCGSIEDYPRASDCWSCKHDY